MANRIKEKYMAGKRYFDYPMLFLVIFLICFGLVMIYSTSSYKSTVTYGNSYHWLLRQAVAIVLGAVAMVVCCKLDYRIMKSEKFGNGCYWASIVLLVLVLIIGAAKKGAVRWISIAGFQFQPSEVSKILVVIYLANRLSANAHKIRTFKDSIVIVLPTVPIIALIVTQNLSTALVVCSMIGVMLFVVSPKMKELMLTAGGGIILLFVYLLTANSYRNERVQIWLHPESHKKGFQTMQALYAIGSGGIFGKGFGNSVQKKPGFIPEAHTDMIFSIICEELGLVGALVIIGLLIYLLYLIYQVAKNSENVYGSVLAMGVFFHIGVQSIINIAVNINLFPNTGIPLPFFSYGGTSIVIIMAEMGLVMSIDRYHCLKRAKQIGRASCRERV